MGGEEIVGACAAEEDVVGLTGTEQLEDGGDSLQQTRWTAREKRRRKPSGERIVSADEGGELSARGQR